MVGLSLRLSLDAISSLELLANRFGMTSSESLSWVLVETGPPHIPKRGKSARSQSLTLLISKQAHSELDRVVSKNESTNSVVVEAYLSRDYH
jgi:hypothetical protein